MAGIDEGGLWDKGHFRELLGRVEGDSFWRNYLGTLAFYPHQPFSLHLVILDEPYLDFILTGKKTVESRFSLKRLPPYQRVSKGDVLLLKRISGPVVGISRVNKVTFYRLDRELLKSIRDTYESAICPAAEDFWREREEASFVTLIWLQNVKSIDPLPLTKRDRRAWVVLSERLQQYTLEGVC